MATSTSVTRRHAPTDPRSLSTRECLPPGNPSLSLSQLVDVFSFGITLYEMIAHTQPWGERDRQEVLQAVARGERPWGGETDSSPEAVQLDDGGETPREWCDLMRHCCEQDPTRRPSFSAILESLKRMLDEHNAPAERMKQEVREQALLQPRFESYAGAQALPGPRRGQDPPVGLPEAQPGAEPLLPRRSTVV